VSPTDWTAELESKGSVVFPPRRGRLAVRLLGFGLLMVISGLTNLQHLRAGDVSGALGVLRITALAAFVYGTGLAVWQLATNRPMLTVDADGITRGRRLPWSAISQIDPPVGLPLARSVRVQPTDRRTRPLTITPDNVDDLDALAPWLRELLEQHRG
jgi:hypothetical protein